MHRERGLPVELQQVLEMVNRRYAEPLRLEELARGAGWSVPHLHDRFKERLGSFAPPGADSPPDAGRARASRQHQ